MTAVVFFFSPNTLKAFFVTLPTIKIAIIIFCVKLVKFLNFLSSTSHAQSSSSFITRRFLHSPSQLKWMLEKQENGSTTRTYDGDIDGDGQQKTIA